jgi:hypothetical protein
MVNRRSYKKVAILLGIILSFAFFAYVKAAYNEQINYQGKLTNTANGTVNDGQYLMRFELFTTSTGGAAIWTENRSGGNKVQVTNGLFSALLGEVTSLSGVNFNQNLYLQVSIGTSSLETMTPRKHLGAVPAAFEAKQLNGQTWDAPGAIGGATPSSGVFTNITSSNAYHAGLSWLNAGGTSITSTNAFTSYLNFTNATGTNINIAGIASAGILFVSDTAVFNGNVGIGTPVPQASLDVNGDMILSGGNRYLNFGTVTGSAGYGIRDNGGTLQYKVTGIDWKDFTDKIDHIINVAKKGGDYDNLADAVAFANLSTSTVIINIYPGTWEVSSTLVVTNPNLKGIRGMDEAGVVIIPTADLVSSPGPIFDINPSSSSFDFSMRLFTIDGSDTPGFRTTAGCEAVRISSAGDRWMNFTQLTIRSVYSAYVVDAPNLVNVISNDIYNIGYASIYLDNGASLQIQDTYVEDSAGYYALVKSSTGSTTFYMVGSEFGSPAGGIGTGLSITGDASYAEIRYSNMWGLDKNIETHDSSHTYITGCFLQTAVSSNIEQNDTSFVESITSDGDYSPGQVSVSYPDGLYINSFSTPERVQVIGTHSNNDQNVFLVDNGASIKPSLVYKSNYYNGAQGLVYTDLTPNKQSFFGVESSNGAASIFATDIIRTSTIQLGLFSAPIPGEYDNIRGWSVNRAGGEAPLSFTFINSDVGDGKQFVTGTDIMLLDGFNQILAMNGGAVFNTSSGNYNFQVKGITDPNLLYVKSNGDKVGIGTTTPGYKLSVEGDVNVSGWYYANGVPLSMVNDGTVTGQMLSWGGSAWSPTSSIFIAADGKIGIGTTTPVNKLSVVGGIYLASSSPANTDYALYNYGGNLYWNGASLLAGNTTSYISDLNGDTRIRTEAAPNEDWIRFDTDSAERMVISSAGNIGIGSSTPGTFFSVAGTSSLRTVLPEQNLTYDLGSSALRWNNAWISRLSVGAVTSSALSVDAFGTLKIFTPGSSTPAIAVTNAGNVGINTSTPLAQMDIYGDMILSGSGRYLNFGGAGGIAGYGFRDNSGIMEVKGASSASWAQIITEDQLDEANIVYVRINGNDANDGDTLATPMKTIQAAITSASASASSTNPFVVNVGAGVYNENISMADYVRVVGAGIDTVINGTVTFNNSTSSVLEKTKVVAVNGFAIIASSTATNVVTDVLAYSTYTNDAAMQAVVKTSAGSLTFKNGSELYLIKPGDFAGVKKGVIFYQTGSGYSRLYVYDSRLVTQNYDNTDDLMILYSENTHLLTTNLIKNIQFTLFNLGSSPANTVIGVTHDGSNNNTFLSDSFIPIRTAVSGSAMKIIGARVANSPISSKVYLANDSFDWLGSGILDSNVYTASAIGEKDKVSVMNCVFNTTNPIMPTRYAADGVSGTIQYLLSNSYGDIMNGSIASNNGSLGIGTSTPYDLLEVWGADLSSSPTSSRNYITIVANGNGEAGNYTRRVNSGGYDNGWSWYMPTSSLDYRLWDDSTGGEGGDDVLTVQAGTGYVGIGRALYNPLNTLHVDGGIYITNTTSATSTSSLYNIAGGLYWNGHLIIDPSGAVANWTQQNHIGGSNLTTSTSIPVWLKNALYVSSSIFADGNLNVLGATNLATTTATELTVNNINVLGAVSTTNVLVANNITLGGVTRNTWPSGGAGTNVWSTTTQNVAYPTLSNPYAIVIGNSVTSSNVIFEVDGNSKFSGNVEITGNATSSRFFATNLNWTNATGTNLSWTSANGTNLIWTSATGTNLNISGMVSSTQLTIGATSTFRGPVLMGNYAQFTTAGDNFLYFNNTTTAFLKWDNIGGRFALSHGLSVGGTASSTALIVNGNATTTGNYYIGGNLNVVRTSTMATATINSLLLADGTSSSPSLAFINDTGVGLFHPSGDGLAFSTSGTERMRILKNGNIGIGTTTPSYKLSIDNGSIYFTTSTNNWSWLMGPGVFPNANANTDPIGLNMAGNSSTWSSGLFSEVGGRLLSYGINTTQIGRNTSSIGIIFRLDTRPGTPYWSIKRQPVGTTAEYSDMQIASTGEVGFGGFTNDTNVFDAQVSILSATGTTRGLTIESAPGQTANLTEWHDSGNNILSVVTASGTFGIGTSTPDAALSILTGNVNAFNIASTTGVKLLEAKNLSAAFGLSVEAGAFIDRNSSLQEEFNKFRTAISAGDTAGIAGAGMGDGGGWGAYCSTSGRCSASTPASITNGVLRMAVTTGVNTAGALVMMDNALGSPRSIVNVANLPVIIIKAKPGNVSANNTVFLGIADAVDGTIADPNNFIGLTNAGGTTWTGRTDNGTVTDVTCTGQTISTTQFALLKIEAVSASKINFYVDNNVSDGVNFTLCGSSTTNIPAINLAPELIYQQRANGPLTTNLEIDYYRMWQDDAATGSSLVLDQPAIDNLASSSDSVVVTPELSIEDKLQLANGTLNVKIDALAASATQDISDIRAVITGYQTVLADNVSSTAYLFTQFGVLNASAQNTQEMISGLNNRITVLENNFSSTSLSIAGLQAQINSIAVQQDSSSSSVDLLQGGYNGNISTNDLAVSGLAAFNGAVKVVGQLSLGADNAGQAKILVGATSTLVTFATPYETLPIITVTPIGVRDLRFGVSDITTSSFVIQIEPPQIVDTTFNWLAFGSAMDARVFVSDGTTSSVNFVVSENAFLPIILPEPVLPPLPPADDASSGGEAGSTTVGEATLPLTPDAPAMPEPPVITVDNPPVPETPSPESAPAIAVSEVPQTIPEAAPITPDPAPGPDPAPADTGASEPTPAPAPAPAE